MSYSTKEGLAQSQVNDIKQDRKKYIWIATLDGLSKFNGKTFENFYQKDGLLSNRISSLSIDKSDNIWAVTSNGISIVHSDIILPFQFNDLFELHRDGHKWRWINKPMKIDDTFTFL
ncbi:MAG: two-component regulator propeller domain-containing protein, partial [Flavobacteriales bacterium]